MVVIDGYSFLFWCIRLQEDQCFFISGLKCHMSKFLKSVQLKENVTTDNLKCLVSLVVFLM